VSIEILRINFELLVESFSLFCYESYSSFAFKTSLFKSYLMYEKILSMFLACTVFTHKGCKTLAYYLINTCIIIWMIIQGKYQQWYNRTYEVLHSSVSTNASQLVTHELIFFFFPTWVWKNISRLFKRLTPAGIIVALSMIRLRALLKPLNTIMMWCLTGFSGALNCAHVMPRDASLSDSSEPDRYSFSINPFMPTVAFNIWVKVASCIVTSLQNILVLWFKFLSRVIIVLFNYNKSDVD